MKKYPRILYFIKGVMPSAEAQEVAEALGTNVAFRNANFVPTFGAPEKCDGVAGDVPELYKKFPTAEEALKTFEEARKEAIEKAKAGKEARAKQSEVDAEAAKKKAEEQKKADEAAAKKKAEEDAKKAEANKSKVAPASASKPADWKPNA